MAENAAWLNEQQGRVRIERFAQLASELETYRSERGALVDYGRRQRAGLPIATSLPRVNCEQPGECAHEQALADAPDATRPTTSCRLEPP